MYKGVSFTSCYSLSWAKGLHTSGPFCFDKEMQDHKDPTAWQAIAAVDRQRKAKKERKEYPKHGSVARYGQLKETGGKHIHINKAEWFYSRMKHEIDKGRILSEQAVEASSAEDSSPG